MHKLNLFNPSHSVREPQVSKSVPKSSAVEIILTKKDGEITQKRLDLNFREVLQKIQEMEVCFLIKQFAAINNRSP